MLWNQEWLQCVWVMQYMLYATPARHMIPSCRCHLHHAPTAPVNTLPLDTTALLETQHARVVGKRVTGKQNATALAPVVCKHPIINPGSKVAERGGNHKLPKSKQIKDPTQRPLHCCNGLQNSRRCAPKGDDHWQHQFPAVQWSIHSHKTACKCQQ